MATPQDVTGQPVDGPSLEEGGRKVTADTLRDFISIQLGGGGPGAEIGDDRPLLREHVIDSLGLVRLVAYIESELGVKIGDEELLLENFETIAAITRLVESKRAT